MLQRSNVAENRKEGFALNDDGNDPTGIKHTESTSSGKAHGIFDAAGRKLNAATIPGLYIVNGRKVILK